MKKLAATATTGSLYLFLASKAFAVNVKTCPTGSSFDPLCKGTTPELGTIIQTVISLLLLAAVIIALVFLIWGGIKWILSGGDKAAVEAARNHVIGAVVGLVIAFAAFFILSFLGTIFGLGNLLDIKVPTFF